MVVLIYVSLPGCHPCEGFIGVWESLKLKLVSENPVKFIHIDLSGLEDSRLKNLTKEYYYFPMLLLTSDDLYQKFTDHTNKGPIAISRYNVVEQDGKYLWSGRYISEDLIQDWFNKSKDI